MVDAAGQPELPAAYRLIVKPRLTDLRAFAAKLARAGAEEGTIIVAENQTEAKGCGDKPWQALQGNLHLALVLQPEFAPSRYFEMLYVAAVSLGQALATHVAPMTALSYSWPNDIKIARHKVASIWLDQGVAQSNDGSVVAWLVITTSINVAASPPGMEMSAISLHQAEGETRLDTATLLETWARQFMMQINDWSERGFEHILRLWKARADVLGASVNLQIGEALICGTVKDVNDHGELIIDRSSVVDDAIVSAQEYMGW